jgi:hypothetical protein
MQQLANTELKDGITLCFGKQSDSVCGGFERDFFNGARNCTVKEIKGFKITDETAFLTNREKCEWDYFKRSSETQVNDFASGKEVNCSGDFSESNMS